MNTTKKQLIHAAFSVANSLNKKIFMHEGDYVKFLKSCEFKISEEVVNGADYTKDLIVHDYRQACELEAIVLDYAPIYGGYTLEQLMKNTGVTHVLSSNRFNAATYLEILRAYNSGLTQR